VKKAWESVLNNLWKVTRDTSPSAAEKGVARKDCPRSLAPQRQVSYGSCGWIFLRSADAFRSQGWLSLRTTSNSSPGNQPTNLTCEAASAPSS